MKFKENSMKIKAVDIASFLNLELIGSNFELTRVLPANEIQKGSVSFISKMDFQEAIDIEALYIVPCAKQINFHSKASYIKSDNPRLAFAKVVDKFFNFYKQESIISSSAKIAKNVTIGKNVSIGDFCTIGDNVTIGDNTILNNSVVIFNNIKIGNSCYIKSGTIIGEDGFGFDFETDKMPVRIPHLGSVVIGDNVEIGAKCTIARGTLSNTIINNDVKIDDQVHIAHNCDIGEKTVITACAEISGSVKVGKRCWIGPNVSIIQKVTIGDDVVIGIGAVVTKDIESKKRYMGLESFELKELLKIKKILGLR